MLLKRLVRGGIGGAGCPNEWHANTYCRLGRLPVSLQTSHVILVRYRGRVPYVAANISNRTRLRSGISVEAFLEMCPAHALHVVWLPLKISSAASSGVIFIALLPYWFYWVPVVSID